MAEFKARAHAAPAAEGRGPGLCRSPSAHEGGGALGWAGSRGVAAGHGAPGACTLRSLPLWNFCPPVRQEGEGCQGARRTWAGPAGRRWACALSPSRGAGVWEDNRGGGEASGGGWRSPRSRQFPACAPSKGSALCPLTSPVPSRRRFHQSPSGQDLRAGEAERRLHAAEADDGEESCARAPGSSRPPLLTGELRGPVGAASRGVPGGCAVLTAPPWPLPLENSQQ